MESLLIAVTVISLGLAVTMSVVAWTLLSAERRRAAARIEALEALAFSAESARHERVIEPPRQSTPAVAAPAASPAPVRAERADDDVAPDIDLASEYPDWDAVIRGDVPDDEPVTTTGRRRAVLPDAMFGPEPASSAATRRLLVVAAIALLAVAGYLTASAMRSPEVVAALAASAPAPSAEPQPLELLSLKHASDMSGGFTVSGFVQNPASGLDLTNVEVVVYLFDYKDQYFMTGRAPLATADMRTGADSPFEVHIPGATNVGRYRVGFRQADGAVVAHVDRRGQFPDGTGEAVVGDVRPAGGLR